MTFSSQHSKTTLAIALGVALAACGGESASPSTGPSVADSRADKGTISTKAPEGATGPIYKSPTSDVYVRGDVLIQALLSKLGNGQPMLGWLDAKEFTSRSVGEGGPDFTLNGAAVLVAEDIKPDTANTGLGAHVAEVGLLQGPLHYPAHIRPYEGDGGIRVETVDQPTVKFGVSLPGMPKQGGGNQPPVTTALEIGKTLKADLEKAYAMGDTSDPRLKDVTMTSNAVSTIQPNEYYQIYGTGSEHWSHTL